MRRNSVTMHCAGSPTRSSIGRLSHSQLQSVWVSLWAWPAVRATDDVKSQLQGKAKQVEGAAQDVYGQVKETASDAVEAIRESTSGAEDFLRTTIEERPY